MNVLQLDNLGTIERKVLGALLVLADNSNNTVKVTLKEIADLIGYKSSGGALSFAVKILERDNYVVCVDRGIYKLLI